MGELSRVCREECLRSPSMLCLSLLAGARVAEDHQCRLHEALDLGRRVVHRLQLVHRGIFLTTVLACRPLRARATAELGFRAELGSGDRGLGVLL